MILPCALFGTRYSFVLSHRGGFCHSLFSGHGQNIREVRADVRTSNSMLKRVEVKRKGCYEYLVAMQ